MAQELTESILYFLKKYKPAKGEIFTGHPVGNYIRNTIPSKFYESGIIDRSKYIITGSVGQGKWANVPWLCIFNRAITTTATKGIYIVYLLSSDGNSLYLTFNQGCTDIKENIKTNQKKETIRIMRERANELINVIDSRGFNSDTNISLGNGLTELAELYQKGTIFYKQYTEQNLPSEEQLQADLKNMLEIYEEYYEKIFKNNGSIEIKQTEKKAEGETSMSETKQKIEHIKSYIQSKGFTYEGNLIENFYLSLKSKPFVILAGTSGTGKTRLAKLFAESIGATEENGQYKLVPVRPDWSDSSDLFGHLDLNDQFIPGAIIDFIREASLPDNISKPYFLCLDEMNLARVEYYMSDFLSIIETRDFDNEKRIKTSTLMSLEKYGTKGNAATRYGNLSLPENLYIIGTVNMDETTFPFSKKVLDRANTIEFSLVDLMPKFETQNEKIEPKIQDNSFLKSEYLKIAECASEKGFIETWTSKLIEINKVLEDASLHVGYRVRDEIMFYLLNNKNAGNLISPEEAFDHEIMQKILPRIQGSSQSVKEVLCELFKICAGDYSDISDTNDSASKQMFYFIESGTNIKYINSAKKIQFMTRRFEEDGFTSYWL